MVAISKSLIVASVLAFVAAAPVETVEQNFAIAKREAAAAPIVASELVARENPFNVVTSLLSFLGEVGGDVTSLVHDLLTLNVGSTLDDVNTLLTQVVQLLGSIASELRSLDTSVLGSILGLVAEGALLGVVGSLVGGIQGLVYFIANNNLTSGADALLKDLVTAINSLIGSIDGVSGLSGAVTDLNGLVTLINKVLNAAENA